MFEMTYTHLKKEWKVIKNAPVALLLLFGVASGASIYIMNWHYSGRVESLKEQVNTYEVKLNVVSPDEALKKMMEMDSKLNTAMDLVEGKINELLLKKQKIVGTPIKSVWPEPICVSIEDTDETKRQVLVYNLMGRKMGIESFFDKTFCQ